MCKGTHYNLRGLLTELLLVVTMDKVSADHNSKIAIIAQVLYLSNLLALPLLSLVALLYLYRRYAQSDDLLGRCHLQQMVKLSLWFFIIVVGGALLIWLIVGDSIAGISMVVLYAVVMHTAFVLLGVLGLANAISGKHFHPIKKPDFCPAPD